MLRVQHEGHNINGRTIDVKAAVSKSRGGSQRATVKLFIGGVPVRSVHMLHFERSTAQTWQILRRSALLTALTNNAPCTCVCCSGFSQLLCFVQREVTSEELKERFAEYGHIEDAAIVSDQNGVSRGFGFVTFDNPQSVEKALICRHVFGDRTVDCKRAVPKEELRPVRCHTIDS